MTHIFSRLVFSVFMLAFMAIIASGCDYTYLKNGEAQSIDLNSIGDVEFARINKTVLSNSCVTCHSAESTKKGGVDLSSYKAVMSVVDPGNPEGSALYQSLLQNGGSMPKGGKPLSKTNVSLVYTWIKNGAPEFVSTDLVKIEKPKEQVPCDDNVHRLGILRGSSIYFTVLKNNEAEVTGEIPVSGTLYHNDIAPELSAMNVLFETDGVDTEKSLRDVRLKKFIFGTYDFEIFSFRTDLILDKRSLVDLMLPKTGKTISVIISGLVQLGPLQLEKEFSIDITNNDGIFTVDDQGGFDIGLEEFGMSKRIQKLLEICGAKIADTVKVNLNIKLENICQY